MHTRLGSFMILAEAGSRKEVFDSLVLNVQRITVSTSLNKEIYNFHAPMFYSKLIPDY